MSQPEYPKREKFFANRVVRLMMKTCAAQEIGTSGFTLVCCIGHTEDAARYRRPVTYYNEQLMPICGMTYGKFARARQRAVEAGWLVYIPGGKGKPGKYWVDIPEHAKGLEDGPIDEGEPDIPTVSPSKIESQTEGETRFLSVFPSKMEEQLETRRRDKRKEMEVQTRTFLPYPSPPPNKARAPNKTGFESMKLLDELQRAWNSLPDVSKFDRLTAKRQKAFAARLSDPVWRDKWREGITRIRQSSFCRGESSTGWKANIDWFLKSDTLTRILEGQYDDGHESPKHRQNGRSGGAGRVRDGETEQYAGTVIDASTLPEDWAP